MHLTNSKDFYSTGMQYLEWYDSLRNDQKQFIISLRYSIAPSTATNEYLEEMVREMCDLLDTAEQEKSKLEDQTDDVVTVFRKDKEKKYTGKEVLDIITKTIGA
jgi:membrane-bound lytic murein transglycosylase MltF